MARKLKAIIRRQPPLKGGRGHVAGAVLPALEARVRAEADRHAVSKSWVLAVFAARGAGLKGQEDY